MSTKSEPQVKIVAVGVESYQDRFLPDLEGASNDVSSLRELLVESPDTALYKDEQFTALIDPSSNKLRNMISQYVGQVP